MWAKEIAGYLIEKNAVKVQIDPPFTWASGIKSPVYCDNRLMIAFPDERRKIVEGFISLIHERGLRPDVIAGTATAAIPWAAFLAYDLDLPMVYIRPEKKEHGAGKQIEGELKPGQDVLLIEDLISTGGSSIKAVEALRDEGQCNVTDVLAIVTWEMPKSIAAFADAALNLATLTNYSNIIQTAIERGYIPQEKLEIILKFKEDPVGWGTTMGF